MKLKKLKCAVGHSGKIVFLQKFPNTEAYGGFHELLDILESDYVDTEVKPGVYLASLVYKFERSYQGYDDEGWLDISKLEKSK